MYEYNWQLYRFTEKHKQNVSLHTLKKIYKIAWDNYNKIGTINKTADLLLIAYNMGSNKNKRLL